MAIQSVKIVGLGLVGGSLAKLWLEAGLSVLGWDSDRETRRLAREAGVDIPKQYEEWLQGQADLVIVATPIDIMESVFSDLVDNACSDQIIADVGSVKVWPARWARRVGIFDNYVGLHPMAGLAASGFLSSDPNVYRDVPWVLVPGGAAGKDNCEVAAFLTRTTEAQLLVTDAESHDHAAALISHLPHVIANSLLSEVAAASCGSLAFGMAAGSFRDLTRVAGIDPSRTANMLLWNRESVLGAIASFAGRLSDVSTNLREDASTLEFLEQAQGVRQLLAAPKNTMEVWVSDDGACQDLADLTGDGHVITSLVRGDGGWAVSVR